MVAEYQPNLRALEARQAGAVRQWEIQALRPVVDHLGGELQSVLELQAGRGGGAGERVDCPDFDFLHRGCGRAPDEQKDRDQQSSQSALHLVPFLRGWVRPVLRTA